MSYCSEKDVRGILTEVDRQALGGTMVESHITTAENIINLKLSKRFTVPFAATPPIIGTICRDLAAFYVLRTLYNQETQNKDNWTLDVYNKTMELLGEMADGTYEVLDSDGNRISEKRKDTKVYSVGKNYSPTFDVDAAENWAVSPSRLADIAEKRGGDV